MKTVLNENGLITNQASGPSTLHIQANSVKAESFYQGDQDISALIISLTQKVNSLFDRVLTMSNELNSLKVEIKQSHNEFVSYKDLEKLEQKLDKELKTIEKASKVQSKTAATKETAKEETAVKQ